MVFEKVCEIIAKRLKIDKNSISLESHIIEDLGADSLDMVEMVMAFEEEYDLEVDDDDVEGISTVADIVDYIEERIK